MPVLDKFSLDGKVAVVTGAGRGIGLVLAHGLAEAGCKVGILELDPGQCRSAEAALNAAGHEALAVEADVTRQDSVAAAHEAIKTAFGAVDILVNNAGGGYRRQDNWQTETPGSIPFELTSMENWRLVQDVNLTSVFVCTQEFGKGMLERGAGTVVNIASMSGTIGNRGRDNSSYAAAKAGVIMLTRQLAAEWGDKGVRVNSISPGYTATEMGFKAMEDKRVKDFFLTKTPMKRPCQPEELQGATIYLASDASSFVTGQDIIVDGGFTLW
ncbi:MAG: SDR family NAD(P)-dependent oxidoreductase [Tropicimonas sp.]|uniref:SDR family NAD(P)-dependent oxidoreductase n=1 Tax=Tropicimonas sp. TaxID=2067044 RepID=UPI003A845E5D